MKKTRYILIALLLAITSYLYCQASLTINNDSERMMTVKVMQSYGGLYKTVVIPAHAKQSVYFSSTGYYYTKTKAIYPNKTTIYQKGKPFEVYNGTDGYSVLTITFTIKESNLPEVLGGKQISKEEFDKN